MTFRTNFFAASLTVSLLLSFTSLTSSSARADDVGIANDTAPERIRVLFIGNSYTQFNNLPRMVRKVAEGVDGGPIVETVGVTHPGATLRHQWNRRHALKAIREGGYTHVVMQPHSLDPFDRPDQMRKFARQFKKEIEKIGAKVVLYNTWARRSDHFLYDKHDALDNPEQMLTALEDIYWRLGQEIDADVAPVGRAWMNTLSENPKTNLYKKDGTHPTQVGTYLTACVFYTLLTGRSAESTEYRPFPMSEGLANRLQTTATVTTGVRRVPDATFERFASVK